MSIELTDISVGQALDQVAARMGVRLSYSPDLVPVARPVCVSADGAPLGNVLLALLGESGVSPVVVGSDEVVLAPTRSAAGAEAMPVQARSTRILERVVVTGSLTGGSERGSPFAISAVDRVALDNAANPSLASIMSGAVPGVWMWAQSPVNALARYGSIRGASSFGVSTPKMYVDGIEVANPLLFTSLDPDQVERIEVIRGPQGAALYGADAISGVVNIVMRRDGADADTPPATVRGSAGASASSFAVGNVLAQDYGASLRRGSPARSVSAGVALSTLGAFMPGANATHVMASASTRHVGSRLIVTGTARIDGVNADSPASPILRSYVTSPFGSSDSGSQRARQYTVGGTATMQTSEQWTHAFTGGVDGYRLAGVSGEGTPLPSTADSVLRAARGGADRLTVRYSATRRSDAGEWLESVMTFGLEHSTACERSSGLGGQLAPRPQGQGPAGTSEIARGAVGPSGDDGVTETSWWSNTGVLTQGELSFGRSLFLSGGARLEHLSGPSEAGRVALLPMLGTSWLHDDGPMTLKLRAAFGRGIRPARTVARGATFTGGRGPETLTSLDPEEQAGIEAGIDAMWGQRLGFHVTRFDQRASGLVQPVAILAYPAGPGAPPGSPPSSRVLYQLQNVGAIDNHGWELQASSTIGSLLLTGTMTLVSSRVTRLASGYLGDLREGDRMLEVPARTFGLQATWLTTRWSVSGSLSRAADWMNYDEVALAQTIASSPAGTLTPVGAALRAYWKSYPGVTRLGSSVAYKIRDRTSILLTGVNLLNHQTGEPDNVTVVPGRTIGIGLRNGF
ncbi:MAG TPA: TonB-dependent receptor [Gemmatimonadaceae bacterium]